jgi:uncharacterized membrane protein
MKTALALITVCFIMACNQSGNPMQIKGPAAVLVQDTLRITKRFTGIYLNDGVGRFLDCEHPGLIYRVKSNNTELDSALKKILPNAYKGEGIYVEMNAEMSSIESKVFSGMLEVKDVLKTEQKGPRNDCMPSDYWCFGTEPFWQLQISKTENLIDFYNPMEQTTIHFNYSEPKISGGITVYTASAKKNRISISIKKEKCNGAADAPWEYSAEIVLNGKRYNGCGKK